MDALFRLRDRLCDDIEELNKKPDMSPTELDKAYKAIDIIKDIYTIEAMENADFGDEEGSYDYDDGMYRGRNSYRRGGRSYDYGYSRRNRMMPMGGRYSGDDDTKEHMLHKIEEMQRKVEQM